jgi:ribose-phosphate pyrophosphokinase
VFSGNAVERIQESPLHEVIVSNSIPLKPDAESCEKVQVRSVGQLLGEACKRIHHGDSISSLFI